MDNTHDAAVCQFCNTPFIVEKAINNYNITVKGNLSFENANVNIEGAPSVSSLLLRARSFISSRDYKRALEYFDRVLDLEPYNSEAKSGIEYLTVPKLENLVIERKKTLMSAALDIDIHVDGRYIGNVYSGKTSYFMIPVGTHVLSIKSDAYLFCSTKFTLPSALQYAQFYVFPELSGSWSFEGNVYDFVRK